MKLAYWDIRGVRQLVLIVYELTVASLLWHLLADVVGQPADTADFTAVIQSVRGSCCNEIKPLPCLCVFRSK